MKLLLIPLGILAFVVFLLILGAIGLGGALGLIWIVTGIFRTPGRLLARRVARRRVVREASGGEPRLF